MSKVSSSRAATLGTDAAAYDWAYPSCFQSEYLQPFKAGVLVPAAVSLRRYPCIAAWVPPSSAVYRLNCSPLIQQLNGAGFQLWNKKLQNAILYSDNVSAGAWVHFQNCVLWVNWLLSSAESYIKRIRSLGLCVCNTPSFQCEQSTTFFNMED